MYRSPLWLLIDGHGLVSQHRTRNANHNSFASFSSLTPLRYAFRTLALTVSAGSMVVLSGCGALVFNGENTLANGSGSSSSAITLSAVSCGTQSLTGAQSKACSVYLTGDATSATVVQLKSSNGALQVPASVTVSAGATSTGFDAVSSGVSAAVSVTITATEGINSKTDVITLYPEQASTTSVTLSKVSCGTSSLTGPTTKACSVYLSGPASNATVVSLSSSSSSLQVQPSVIVAAGSSTAGFGVTALAVSTTQAATLTASADGVLQTDVIDLLGSGAQNSSQHQVVLSWIPPNSTSDPVVGYKVYRSVSGSGFQLLNSSVETSTSYTDLAVQSGTTYDYVVRSVDSSGNESAPSNPTTVTVP